MKLIGSSKDGKRHVFECLNCDSMRGSAARVKHRCPACGHTDDINPPIRYYWTRKSCGYSRLFPPEDIKKAMSSIYQARRQGVSFDIKRTFAGMRVTVTSLPINKKVKKWDF